MIAEVFVFVFLSAGALTGVAPALYLSPREFRICFAETLCMIVWCCACVSIVAGSWMIILLVHGGLLAWFAAVFNRRRRARVMLETGSCYDCGYRRTEPDRPCPECNNGGRRTRGPAGRQRILLLHGFSLLTTASLVAAGGLLVLEIPDWLEGSTGILSMRHMTAGLRFTAAFVCLLAAYGTALILRTAWVHSVNWSEPTYGSLRWLGCTPARDRC